MNKITVLGCGGWGIGLAVAAHDAGNAVTLWSYQTEEARRLQMTRRNDLLLPDVVLPDGIAVTDDLSAADGSDLVILAVPSFAVRETVKKLAPCSFDILVSAAKGLERGSDLRLSAVAREERPGVRFAALSGPTHAEEVARRLPTAAVISSDDAAAALRVQTLLGTGYFRLYTNDDLIGTEIGGAFKNVIAVCSGILSGMGCGDNARAALITRGIREITRLGVALGAREETFGGLTGLGDLVVTCTSLHSRNNRFGMMVGQGRSPKDALAAVGTVEGYYAAAVAAELAEKIGIEMPICRTCYAILYEGADCHRALDMLMTRPLRAESEDRP